MIRKSLMTLLAFTALSAAPAQALLLEPYVGYHFGSFKDNSGAGSGSTESFNGFGFGARAAMTLTDMFFAGVDFAMAPLTLEADSGDTDIDYMSLGAVVGVGVSDFRFWGGLNFINEFTFVDDSTGSGMGFKIGAGYKFIPLLSLNVEYLINPINESCDADDNCADINSDVSANSFFVSVSAPLSF